MSDHTHSFGLIRKSRKSGPVVNNFFIRSIGGYGSLKNTIAVSQITRRVAKWLHVLITKFEIRPGGEFQTMVKKMLITFRERKSGKSG
jgi:hypothetical protein